MSDFDFTLLKDENGNFTVPDLDMEIPDLNLDLPTLNVPDIGLGELMDQLSHLPEKLVREQIKLVRGARAIQTAASQIQVAQKHWEMHLKAKELDKSNLNSIHIVATPHGVYSEERTPFLKKREHSIDSEWNE